MNHGLGGEVIAQAILDGSDMGINDLGFALGFLLSGLVVVLDEFLGRANRHVLSEDLVCDGDLLAGIFYTEDGLGVAHGEVAIGKVPLDGGLEVEEAHRVGDAGPGFTNAFGNDVLFEPEVFGEAHVTLGFFDGIEVLALQVLNEGHFEDLPVARWSLNDGDGFQSQEFGGPPASLAGDEFHLAIDLPDDERLDNAELLDGLLQFVE